MEYIDEAVALVVNAMNALDCARNCEGLHEIEYHSLYSRLEAFLENVDSLKA